MRGSQAMFRLTLILPLECYQPPSCTTYARPYFVLVQGSTGFLGLLHPFWLCASPLPTQTRPNLGGVKDLSVSRSETAVPASPAAFFRSWRESSRRVRGLAWQVDSTASSPGADIAGPGNWPHWLSNAPAAKSKTAAPVCQQIAEPGEITLGLDLRIHAQRRL